MERNYRVQGDERALRQGPRFDDKHGFHQKARGMRGNAAAIGRRGMALMSDDFVFRWPTPIELPIAGLVLALDTR